MKKVTVILFCLPLTLFGQKSVQKEKTIAATSEFKVVEDSITSKIAKGFIPSFSVAVSKNGKVIWQQSYGWADKENKIKATPSTSYALASLSKSITATAIMMLAQKGVVNLNAPAEKYFGNIRFTCYKGTSSEISINHLLNMTAGLPHEWEYIYADAKRQPLPIAEQIKRYGIVVFPPGEVFNYSNLSPGTTEQIIRHVTNKRLQTYMQENLFSKLGMCHTAVNRNNLTTTNVAKGYDNAGHLLSVSEFFPKAGAGYYASAADLLRYGMFHLKDKQVNSVLSEKNIDVLHTPLAYTPQNKFYANGWGVLNLGNGKTSLISNGAIDGAASCLLLLPDSNIAIVCLTNATVGNDFTDQFAYTIADVLIPGYMAELEKFVEANETAFVDKPFKGADSLTGIWEGEIKTYVKSIPVQMVFDSNGKIFMQIQGQLETLLNNVTVNNGLIQAQSFGNLELPETQDISQYVQLTFKPVNNEIYGSISAQSFQTKRPYFLLPAYLSLKKSNLTEKMNIR